MLTWQQNGSYKYKYRENTRGGYPGKIQIQIQKIGGVATQARHRRSPFLSLRSIKSLWHEIFLVAQATLDPTIGVITIPKPTKTTNTNQAFLCPREGEFPSVKSYFTCWAHGRDVPHKWDLRSTLALAPLEPKGPAPRLAVLHNRHNYDDLDDSEIISDNSEQ